ncbi:MAG: ferrous iron transport protein A [Candidatus Omnitrophica bacterium]|nr:ferrous iron transport protein A [Candidatus Omnitrophota bacterium]
MKCTLCGFEFSEESAHAACGGCGFVNGCELVKCPRCDFENAPEPKWIKKLFLKQEKQKNQKSLQESDLRLDELEINKKARVSFVQMGNRSTLQKIIAIGALPNTELVLLQKFPSFVFQIGFSQFSIDRELASCIYVSPVENGSQSEKLFSRENEK